MLEYFTVDDYYAIKPDDMTIWELIKGSFLMSPSPTLNHQEILGKLYLIFGTYFKNQKCKCFISPIDVRLGDSIVNPDLCVICDESKITKQQCVGAPDLIIEITSSNVKRDTQIKFNLYEEYGVKEYWIVNPINKSIQQYHLQNNEFSFICNVGITNAISSVLFPDISFNVSDVL